MIPTVAVAVMLCVIAGCCIYLSYRIGEGISPASRLIQRRLARVEAAVVRSEVRVKQTLEHHRQETSERTRQLLLESAEALKRHVGALRRPIDDIHERLNGVRLDLSRESNDLREDVENAIASIQNATREYLGELARAQADTLEKITGRLRELGHDDERRHGTALVLFEGVATELEAAYGASVSELREILDARMTEAQQAAMRIDRRVGEHGTQLGRTEEELKAALYSSGQQYETLSRAVDSRLTAIRAHATQELELLRATSDKHEDMWREIKRDFDALGRSLLHIQRAIEAVRNQLTVPLRDADAHIEVKALLERILQPDEFECDLEIEPGTGRRVEFAVRLSDNPLTKVWLPIAVLSVVDGYHELVAACVYGDPEQLNGSSRTFDNCVFAAAEDLSAKFIAPPQTMNLAVLFVPTEDLYGEIVRRDALVETLLRDFNVIVAGQVTLPTLLRGLRKALRGTVPSTARVTNGTAVRKESNGA